jgi:hypothetical protein
MTQKERQANKVLKMITEGKENLLVENPLLMGLLRMGLMNYLFGDAVKTQVNKLSQRYPDLSPTELLKKAGLDVKASEKELEDYTKDQYLDPFEKKRLGFGNNTYSSMIGAPNTDNAFYERVLKDLGVPVTEGNILFLKGVRQSEGANARYNPFNTTMKRQGSTCYNVLKRDSFGGCKSGVQNYLSQEDGIDATVDTLKLNYYKDVVNGMRNDVGPVELSRRWSASPWGTGELVKRVVSSYMDGAVPSPKPIAR